MRRHQARINFADARRASPVSLADKIMFLGAGHAGARSPGVRHRRRLERPELDLNERMRRRLAELRGLPRSWRA
jgi:hypothetical protein